MRIDPQDNEARSCLLATPPRGAALALWVAVFLLLGSIGHDPWRGDDATNFGVIWSFAQQGFSLTPQIAGIPFLDYPPLYHWVATLFVKLFGALLSAPDAARLSSGIWAAGLMVFTALAARRWHGASLFGPTVLLVMGTLGLLVHSHECQPMIAVCASAALGYYGFAHVDRHPAFGALIAALAQAAAVLSGGLVGGMLLAPLWLLLPLAVPLARSGKALGCLAIGFAISIALIVGVGAALAALSPLNFEAWMQAELTRLIPRADGLTRLGEWFKMLAWFTWPALPLAGWALWQQRRQIASPPLRLPLLYLLVAIAVVVLLSDIRSARALPLIAPLALLASGGLPTLRRGAANAFDWFAVMTFTLLGGFVWFAWNTLATGHPERFARNLSRLAPDFVFQLSLTGLALAVALTLTWLWLLHKAPRAPHRGITHWAAGVILFWGLSATLVQPWVDYGKSYRATLESMLSTPRKPGCVAGRGLGTSQRASLHYFGNLQPRADFRALQECATLITQQPGTGPDAALPEGWQLRWEGRRPGDRNETLRLYVRN